MDAPPTQADYFNGIDGGGSRCRSRFRDADRRLLASVHGRAANVYHDLERAVAVKTGSMVGQLRVPMLGATEDAIMLAGGRVPYLGSVRSMADALP